jgi:predicted exporter
MIVYLSGWLTVLGLAFTTALFVMNYYNPKQGERRIWLHCTVGKLTLVTTLVHIYVYPFDGFKSFAIWSAVGLILITIGTGVILSYLPDAGKIRFQARSFHPALMVGIAVAMIHHILVQLSII